MISGLLLQQPLYQIDTERDYGLGFPNLKRFGDHFELEADQNPSELHGLVWKGGRFEIISNDELVSMWVFKNSSHCTLAMLTTFEGFGKGRSFLEDIVFLKACPVEGICNAWPGHPHMVYL